MVRWTKRACVFNEELNRWVSPTTGKSYSIEQYERLCETGRKAAATAKERAAIVASEDYQRDVAEMMARQEARKDQPMIRLPGQSDWQHGHHVAVDRAMRNFRRRS
jgi:hypothetical protein